MDTILASTKVLLGIPIEVTDFDVAILMHINTVLLNVHELGFGSDILLADPSTDFADLFPASRSYDALLQMYIYTKTRLLFDPPASSFVLEALTKTVEEYEFRLSTVDQT